MTDTVFSKASEGATGVADQQIVAPDASAKPTLTLPPELEELIGEGKKYSNLEAALKSIPHAQKHIKQLEEETADLRARKVDVEEILANMSKGSTSGDETTQIDENTVADRVIAKLTAKDQEAVKANNLQLASDTLATKVGGIDAAAKLIVAKAKELGLAPTDLQRLAEKSPTAFLAYFNETLPNTNDRAPMSGGKINSEAFAANAARVEEGTYAWYQAQRKTKGDNWYFSEAATRQRTKDADRLGREKFFGKQH